MIVNHASKHILLQKNEYFVGNINVSTEESFLKRLNGQDIKYRIGETAYDITGSVITQKDIKPLIIIGKKSLDAYNHMQQRDMQNIRKGIMKV